jgi:hypothetical protein
MIFIHRKARIQRQLTIKDKYVKPKPKEVLLIKDDQIGRCAICECEFPKDTKHIHVDHCHKTNIIRGFLCASCNKGLGFFKDDVRILERAISYLKLEYFNQLV